MPDPAYGYRHQLQRGAAMAVLIDGTPCPLCGLGMYRDKTRNPDGRSLHYDHVVPVAEGGANGPKRLCHAFCNLSRGGRDGAAITNGKRWGRPVAQPRPREVYNRW